MYSVLKSSITDQIYDIITDRIINLELRFGARIEIQMFENEFGISQTPIRFALNKLQDVGLVESKPRGGYFVIDLTEKDLDEIYDLREMFEVFALGSAIKSLDMDELQHLKKEIEQLPEIENEEKRKAKFNETDEKLHLLLINSSDNKRAKVLYLQVYDILKISISMGIQWKSFWNEHLILIDALLNQDLNSAQKILKNHLREAKKNAIQQLRDMEQQQIYAELDRRLREPRLRRLYQKMETAFNDLDPGAHNWDHVRRVIVNSIEIGLGEKANMNIVMPAVILHDLGYITNPDDPKEHPAHGARACYRFLDEWGPADQSLIADCIRKHKAKYPGFATPEPETKEEQVVSDADQVDKFGWIGFIQVVWVYIELGIGGMERYQTIGGLVDAMSHHDSIAFYTGTGKTIAARLADPDFGQTGRKLTQELSLYAGWKPEF